MRQRCQERKEQKQKMMADMKAQDAELTEHVAKMNSAPEGKKMGHAGAIITGGKGKAEDKIRTLTECGVTVSASPTRMGDAMLEALKVKRSAKKK